MQPQLSEIVIIALIDLFLIAMNIFNYIFFHCFTIFILIAKVLLNLERKQRYGFIIKLTNVTIFDNTNLKFCFKCNFLLAVNFGIYENQ